MSAPVAIAYAHRARSGLAISSGHELTWIVPVWEGKPLYSKGATYELAGAYVRCSALRALRVLEPADRIVVALVILNLRLLFA